MQGWTIPSPYPFGFRCRAPSLYTRPEIFFSCLARDCLQHYLRGFPEFARFSSYNFLQELPFCQQSSALPTELHLNKIYLAISNLQFTTGTRSLSPLIIRGSSSSFFIYMTSNKLSWYSIDVGVIGFQ